MLDGVHGAGRPGAVLVGGAGIIYIFPALAPGDGFPTVRTFQKAAEQMELPALGGRPGIPEQEDLHPVKGFVGEDCARSTVKPLSGASRGSKLIF